MCYTSAMKPWNCPECGKLVENPKRRGPHLSGCRRKATAKYQYDDVKDPQHKHPLTPRTCKTCALGYLGRTDKGAGRFCSSTCAQTGEANSNWAGAEPDAYITQHHRVYQLRGPARTCVWGCSSDTYDWANLTGHYTNPDDYAAMCRKCHSAYDQAIAKCFDKTCKRGHILNNRTMYVKYRKGKEIRQCKQCAKDRAAERRKTNV